MYSLVYRLMPVFFMIFAVQHTLTLQASPITLEKIWKQGYFAPQTIHMGKSMLDGEHYTLVENKFQINKYSYESGKFIETLADIRGIIVNENGETPPIDAYYFDSSEKQLLIAVNTESIYRHSSISDFYVFNVSEQTATPLSDNGPQRLPLFSPDAERVAFVRDNNVFIKEPGQEDEVQVTHDGLINHVINGTTDWVYEEEFGFTRGFHWSPDGRRIAFYRFDESDVKEFSMSLYGTLYPEKYRFKYPKAGEDNAVVSIHVYDLRTGQTLTLNTGEENDQYIPRIKWTAHAEKLAVSRLNRHQNHLEILAFDVTTGAAQLLYEEKNRYYIEINDDLYFTRDGMSFLISSEKSGFNHLYRYDMNGNLLNPVTSGQWDVNAFLGLDEKNSIVYYTSHEQSPMENHLYSIGADGENKIQLTHKQGYNKPAFSNNFLYFINNHTTINTPPVYSIHKADGSLVKILQDNSDLEERLQEHNYGEIKFIEIPVDDDVLLNSWILYPPDFDPNQEYPLFMYVYGGPGSQTVTHSWNTYNGAWFQMLAQMGYIVVSVDNRGTGGRGEEFRKMTYQELGKYETIDLIEAASWLGNQDYIDRNRMGIFGWSYGGYLSSLCLAKGADVFSAAIAVAPVTNWRFYDTVYTERYMRTPEENPAGYDNNSPINHVDKIKGAYLLVHGSADDNVHYQNTMEMAGALIEADVDFELMIYPNHNHSIAGGNARLHLYRLMTDFLTRKLQM